jgi:hypothetical protein
MAKTQPAFIQHWKSDYALVVQLVELRNMKWQIFCKRFYRTRHLMLFYQPGFMQLAT